MKLKLIILLLTISSLSFGQDNLQKDSMSKSSKSYVKNAKKNRKKNKYTELKKETSNNASNANYQILLVLIVVLAVAIVAFTPSGSGVKPKRRHNRSRDEDFISDALMRLFKNRHEYYNDVYLKSDAWKRKRYLVLKRDNWRCVHCGADATQVHHKKYAPKNIGKEPIEWLESVCKTCHDSLHR